MTSPIHIGVFGGEAPAIDGRILPEGKGKVSRNVRTGYGRLEPLRVNRSAGVTLGADTQTIFLYNRDANAGQGFWLQWNTPVDVLASPVIDDVHDRVYWTGDGAPKMAPATILTTAEPYPSNAYLLGIPAPDATMLATVDGTPSDEEIAQAVTYVVTYVSAYGEEGPPPASTSDVVDRPDGHSTTLSNIPTAPLGNHNIDTKRIYRSSGGDYLLVAEIPVAQTSYADTVLDRDLGPALESLNFDMPDAEMVGLTLHPAGFMVGYKGNELCFSEAYLPHAWPTGYRLSTKADITGIAVTNAGIVVGTEEEPYLVVGSSPDAMQPVQLDSKQACLSARGMVDMGEYVLYPSPDGLLATGGGETKNLTESLFTKQQWSALQPSSFHAYRYDGKYVCFHATGAFILDPKNGDLVPIDDEADCALYDGIRDVLYLCTDGVLTEFDAGTAYREATWRSRTYISRDEAPYGAARIDADAYPVIMKVFGDGVLIDTLTFSDDEAVRMANTDRYRKTEIEITSSNVVHSVDLALSTAELMQ